jgi:AcrR family transcriptional regulator
MEAALAELAQVGYRALKLEDVATRAGVAKTTLYRRWPTKSELVRASLREIGIYAEPLPDTGSVRKDMLVLLERTMKLAATPQGRAIHRLINIERTDPEVEDLLRHMKEESRVHRGQVITRAMERGDLPENTDPILIIDTIFALVMGRLMRFNEHVDRKTCERLIDLVITGAEYGGGALPTKKRSRSKID